MTQQEFKIWLEYHAANFPKWAEWMSKLDLSADPLLPKSRSVSAAIFDVLGDVSLVDAKEATARFARGDEAEIFSFDMHPRSVRTVARRLSGERLKNVLSARVQAREKTYACHLCWDAAPPFVTVFHPESVREARDPERAAAMIARTFPVYTCAVACTCRAGREHADATKTKLFNPSRMLVSPNRLHWGEQIEKLIAWANRPERHQWTGDVDEVFDQQQIEYDPTV